MDSEPTRPLELDESQSSKLSSINPSDMDSGSDSDSSNGGVSEAAPQVEWLATGRQRRSTAGNRMKSMLANEEPDSDLELLFAEDDDDQGFSDAGEHISDVQMDSSSDDDDNNDDDDLQGEKELDRQAKERRAAQRKRKAQEAIPAKFRKKVRIDTSNSTPRSSVAPSTPLTSQPRPKKKKKSERASWLPSVTDMPTRASSRQTTRLSKEQLHAQMEEREAKRLKQLAQMQKKAARLEALKKPPMTQEDRLREAALVEERNSKSLNRWEEAEKQREEERRAKLAALHERTLSGPVITFWSGKGRFGDGWRRGEGIHVAVEEKPKKAKKEKVVKEKGKKKDDAKDGVKEENVGETKITSLQGAHTAKPPSTGNVQDANAGGSGELNLDANKETLKLGAAAESVSKNTVMADAPDTQTQETTSSTPAAPATNSPTVTKTADEATKDAVVDVSTATEGAEKSSVGEAASQDGATERTSMEPKTSSGTQSAQAVEVPSKEPGSKATTPSKQPAEAESYSKEPEASVPVAVEAQEGATPSGSGDKEPQSQPASTTQLTNGPRATTGTGTMPPTGGGQLPKTTPLQPIENESLPASKVVSQIQSEAATPQPEQIRSPLDGLATTRDAIIYQNFDSNAIKDKGVQTQVLFGRKMGRLPKPTSAPICPITCNTARYRDPKTNLHFYSADAFKELQRVRSGEYRWSRLLGAWVGSGTCAARGVPERFLNPSRCPTLEEVERIQRKKEEKEKLKLQQAEDDKKASEKKTTASDKRMSGNGAPAPLSGGATAAEEVTSVDVKMEDAGGTKVEAPFVAA
ncbi:YL1 nuclear [Beauveria brongniartii RCEF 3172]|uniref:YL1 nuclear n=1 Tax=Beauveria brongniartii RCEF 3172 TaxID=1081107 RepID=A0A166XEU4_9HYPO|nr:YL1 nuclear [Beauveria brongniartii RCEF 3172]